MILSVNRGPNVVFGNSKKKSVHNLQKWGNVETSKACNLPPPKFSKRQFSPTAPHESTMSQESLLAGIGELGVARSASELDAAARELDQEMAEHAAGGAGAGAIVPAAAVAATCAMQASVAAAVAAKDDDATGANDSSNGSSSDDDDDELEQARAAFEAEVKAVTQVGKNAGVVVKKKAAEYYVESSSYLLAHNKTILDCKSSADAKTIHKKDVVAVVTSLKSTVAVYGESDWANTQESMPESEEDNDYLEQKSLKELTTMQVEKTLELQDVEDKIATGAVVTVFKEFARVAKKEPNASELKALSSKVKSESEKPFFKNLDTVGHELMIKVHQAAIEEATLPSVATTLSDEIDAIRAAKAKVKAMKEEAKEEKEIQKLLAKKRETQSSPSPNNKRRK